VLLIPISISKGEASGSSQVNHALVDWHEAHQVDVKAHNKRKYKAYIA
jgi:hypothetical protein